MLTSAHIITRSQNMTSVLIQRHLRLIPMNLFYLGRSDLLTLIYVPKCIFKLQPYRIWKWLYLFTYLTYRYIVVSTIETVHWDFGGSVAQWIEHQISNSKVPGSTPHMGTPFFVSLDFTFIISHPRVKWVPGWTVIESRCTIVSSCATGLYAPQGS